LRLPSRMPPSVEKLSTYYIHAYMCGSAYGYICLLILLHTCPHTATYVSSYGYIRVLILIHTCPHTATYVSSCGYIRVLILLHTCPHTPTYVSSYGYIRVLILLHTCPHTSTYVSSYGYIRVLILLHTCPHISTYVSSYYLTCVLPLHQDPHDAYKCPQCEGQVAEFQETWESLFTIPHQQKRLLKPGAILEVFFMFFFLEVGVILEVLHKYYLVLSSCTMLLYATVLIILCLV
jgi:hypothetical protein